MQQPKQFMDFVVKPQLSMVIMNKHRNIIILHPLDRYFFLIVSPALIVLQAFIIFTIYFYRLYKNTPMDIILACFVSEISINISYFSTASKYHLFQFTIRFILTIFPCLAHSPLSASLSLSLILSLPSWKEFILSTFFFMLYLEFKNHWKSVNFCLLRKMVWIWNEAYYSICDFRGYSHVCWDF